MVNIEVVIAIALGSVAHAGIDLMTAAAFAWMAPPKKAARSKLGQASVSCGGLSSKLDPDRAYACSQQEGVGRGAFRIARFAPGVALNLTVMPVSVALASK
jgi:hypothetical protein